jgi:hypothetical protein
MVVLTPDVGSTSIIAKELNSGQLWNSHLQSIPQATQSCAARAFLCAGHLFQEVAAVWIVGAPN